MIPNFKENFNNFVLVAGASQNTNQDKTLNTVLDFLKILYKDDYSEEEIMSSFLPIKQEYVEVQKIIQGSQILKKKDCNY